MKALDISVTLNGSSSLDIATHAHALATRLVSWPGLVCTGSSVDPDGRTLSGRYMLTRSGRRSRSLHADLERALRLDPSVSAFELHGLGSVPRPARRPTTITRPMPTLA